MVDFTKRHITTGAMSVNELRGRRLSHGRLVYLQIAAVILAACLIVAGGLLLAKYRPGEPTIDERSCEWLMRQKRVMEIECAGGCRNANAERLVTVQDELINRCDPTGVPQNGKVD